jgi:hypothetical protein
MFVAAAVLSLIVSLVARRGRRGARQRKDRNALLSALSHDCGACRPRWWARACPEGRRARRANDGAGSVGRKRPCAQRLVNLLELTGSNRTGAGCASPSTPSGGDPPPRPEARRCRVFTEVPEEIPPRSSIRSSSNRSDQHPRERFAARRGRPSMCRPRGSYIVVEVSDRPGPCATQRALRKALSAARPRATAASARAHDLPAIIAARGSHLAENRARGLSRFTLPRMRPGRRRRTFRRKMSWLSMSERRNLSHRRRATCARCSGTLSQGHDRPRHERRRRCRPGGEMPPRVVIPDLGLPDLDGVEVTSRIPARAPFRITFPRVCEDQDSRARRGATT